MCPDRPVLSHGWEAPQLPPPRWQVPACTPHCSSPLQKEGKGEPQPSVGREHRRGARATSPPKASPARARQSPPEDRPTHHSSGQPAVPPDAAGMESRQNNATEEPEIELFVKVGLRGRSCSLTVPHSPILSRLRLGKGGGNSWVSSPFRRLEMGTKFGIACHECWRSGCPEEGTRHAVAQGIGGVSRPASEKMP